ncbi:putative DNA-binding domain-containing protein [Methyloceanibacter marginalis]|uniref:HvfC/BufC family peptide modification chaperone n=1 Tax=Methyloceanibacter marginalis TaxID=1774971 RepID=UPI00084C71B0|nr:putative DNA-binding domain-containing protein [Methyloceanibacter marginalis]
MTGLKQLQERFQAGILAGEDTILDDVKDSARERRSVLFGVYRNAYVARLAEILGNDYTQLHTYLGDEASPSSPAPILPRIPRTGATPAGSAVTCPPSPRKPPPLPAIPRSPSSPRLRRLWTMRLTGRTPRHLRSAIWRRSRLRTGHV